jgi:hypothetical protein
MEAAMAAKSVEERLRVLEEKNAALEHEVMRLRAINEIQNLLGRYEAIHNPTDIHRSWEFFARHTPGTWMEISDWGWFEGFDLIKQVWTGMNDPSRAVGTIFEHDLATPVIQVAGDGNTAKGTWCSPGYETHLHPDGTREPVWCWGKYAIDFVKEDGEWRFWHFKWFRTFMIPFDTSWVDAPPRPSMRHEAGKPSQYHRPYRPDSVAVSIPPAPAPYATWTADDAGWQFRPADKP